MHHGIAESVQSTELVRQLLSVLSKLGGETLGKELPVVIDDFGEMYECRICKHIIDRIRIILACLCACLSYLQGNTQTPPLTFGGAELLYQRRSYQAMNRHFRIGEILR